MGSIPHGGIFLSFVFLFLKVNIILKHFCLRLHDIGTISEGSEDHIFFFFLTWPGHIWAPARDTFGPAENNSRPSGRRPSNLYTTG